MEEYTQLIIQFLEGKLSSEAAAALTQWRNAQPENENHFQEVKFLWKKSSLTKSFAPPISIDVKAALENVHQQLPQHAPPKIISLRRRFTQISTAAAVILLAGMFWWGNAGSVDFIEVSTMAGERKEVRLPDETMVWLNENSTLIYPENFGKKERNIKMNGNLVFEVTPDKRRPFIVKSDDLAVQVLGTKFNVISNNNENTNSLVHVLHGKVKVQRDDLSGNQVILEKGMSAMLNQKDSLFQTNAFSANRLFWLNKKLVFDNMSLDKVVEDLEYIFEAKLDIENPKILPCSFTAKFGETITIPEILEMMTVVFGVEIEEIKSNHYKIKKGNLCN